MSSNRFDNLNIDLIIQNLQIDDNKLCGGEDEFNYESPTINPNKRNKYENQNQESDYKVSSKYKGNSKVFDLEDSCSSLEDQPMQQNYEEGNKENNLSIGSCTPPRKSYINEFDQDEESEENCQENSVNNGNLLKRTPQNNYNLNSPPQNNHDGGKFKITLEKFKLSASSSNKKFQEQIQQQKSSHKQQVLLSSNRKNCASIFDKESPYQNSSCYSNKNGNFSQTPKILNYLNSSATPQKKLVTRTVNGKHQHVNSMGFQESKQSNIFMSSQPYNHYFNSDQKNIKEQQPSYSKRLFQNDTDDEEEQQQLQNSSNKLKQNLISRFDSSDTKVKNKLTNNLDRIEEFNSPLPTSNNLLGSFDNMNNLFASPCGNSSKKKVPLFATENTENDNVEKGECINNNAQQIKTNNLFSTTDTIPKKGLAFLKDDQSTVKKNIFSNIQNSNPITSLDQVSVFFSKETQQNTNQPFNQHSVFSQNKESQNFVNNFFLEETNKNKNETNNSSSNKLNHPIIDFNQLNLPQVNEFSFETEKEEEEEVDTGKNQRANQLQNRNNFFNDEYDSDNFIRKGTKPADDKWDEDSQQSEEISQYGQNSFVTEDYPDQNNLQLIKGKSVNLLSYENDLRNQNDTNVWNLGLNRRNSEVGLDSNDQRNKIQIDIGENEFTRAMPGIKSHQRPRIGSLVQNKKRSQTVLFQIPEGSTKKPKQIQTQLANHFDIEDDFDVQTPIRSKMIEQQDFSILFKKASSQFFANNLVDRDYIMPSSMQHNKENRFTKDFKILQVLKQTPLSSVYKCQSNVNGLIYAIKVISIPQDSFEQEKIIKEVQSLVKFSTYGFGILKFYNVWMEDSKLYLVTEHCLHNLRQIRNTNQKPSEQLIRQIIRDICESLNFLHQNDCAHLGIKPENILVSKKMKFKLADLGLSKIQPSESNLSQQESYFPYIAPELVGGCLTQKQNIKSIKADIFSFGSVLYELMTDQDLPKYGPEWENLRSGRFHKLMNSVKYSASLKNLIKSMLLRNPQLRPSCQDILNQIPPDNALELELKYIVEENNLLSKKLEELQKKTDQTNNSNNNNPLLKKKVSF